MSNKKVLIVSTDSQLGDQWLVFLRRLGYAAELSRNELSLVPQMLELNPQAVFVVINMTHEGALFVQKIREQKWFRGKVFILEKALVPVDLGSLIPLGIDGVFPAEGIQTRSKLKLLGDGLGWTQKEQESFADQLGLPKEKVVEKKAKETKVLASSRSDYQKWASSERLKSPVPGLSILDLKQRLSRLSQNQVIWDEGEIRQKKREFFLRLVKKTQSQDK